MADWLNIIDGGPSRRTKWLTQMRGDLSNLYALNYDFTRWVEGDYNGREHFSLGRRCW